ncbi:redoxin domain-containing protein [Deinococcus humi]|uniref:Peroxiredoxin n=1 Tax=Deinococcus humi TaxID=662880 RepID=A0A7W8K153_9DEIO|nr:redoxin domain-containing protein [Deinococcus humi]MBB5365319.1 peroxiredoxin [Deinococcus humi]GGO36352.1 peroxiredoxin [Deinococcus humi]
MSLSPKDRQGHAPLQPGASFPSLRAAQVGGGPLTLPDHLAGFWGVVLFYRGHGCGYSRWQLLDFQKRSAGFEQAGARVVALSTDPKAQAQRTAELYGLTFPVLWGADAHQVAASTGAYVLGDPPILQSTGFLLQPDGKVALAVYSSGAVGRLVAHDTLRHVQYLRRRAPAEVN